MLRYQSLKYFTVVAENESITKAAEKLFIGQSGLSVHMKNLEEELGVTLFVRTNRNVFLTEAGKALYEWTSPFFNGEKAALDNIRQIAIDNKNQLFIGTVGGNISYFLPDIIKKFSEIHPEINVHVQRYNMDPLNEVLEKNAVDLGFQFEPNRARKGYGEIIIEKGHLVLAVNKMSPLASLPFVTYKDLKDVPLGALSENSMAQSMDVLVKNCARLGFKPNIVMEMEYIEPLLSMVNVGSCAVVTSDLAPKSGLENVVYIPMEGNIGINLSLIWKEENKKPAARYFIEFINKYIEEQ